MGCGDSGGSSSPLGKSVEAFTGARTRVVWVEDVEKNSDTFAKTRNLRLMGFDSRDGRDERVILEKKSNYQFPLFTPDGSQIVYSDSREDRIHVVDWDGRNLRTLKEDASAAEVWQDPKTKVVWVYAQKQPNRGQAPIFRFPLKDPGKEEIVWKTSPIEALPPGGFQLNRSGTKAAAGFPWPNIGLADVADETWVKHIDGCWPSMAPDDSMLSWTFDGPHRELFMKDWKSGRSWQIPIATAPGVNQHETYHPRWSNHVQFMAMTGPYATGDKPSKLLSGADGVEIYLGKFNDHFTGLSAWFKLTDSKKGEFFPDIWIAGGELSNIQNEPGPPRVASPVEKKTNWPEKKEGLIFLWKDNGDSNQFIDPSGEKQSGRVQARGAARFGPDGQMHVIGGSFEVAPKSQNTQALTDAGQFTIEAVVTPGRASSPVRAGIITLNNKEDKPLLAIQQKDDKLLLFLKNSGADPIETELGTASTAPTHILLTYSAGQIAYYQDGHLAKSWPVNPVDFGEWSVLQPVFGSLPWSGYLDGIAIFNRAMSPDEVSTAAALARERVSARALVPRHQVSARLLKKQVPPDAESIAPYRRALVVNRYKVAEGPAELKGKTVQVAEWAMLDAEIPASYTKLQPEEVYDLELEPYDAHPQLESERTAGDLPSLDEDFYYHIQSGL